MCDPINLNFFNFRATLTIVEYSGIGRKKSGVLLLLTSVILVSETRFLFSDLLIQLNSVFLIYKPLLSLTELFI